MQIKFIAKEDIVAMGDVAVNEGWGPKGAPTYSLWLFKGGGNCFHRWNKQVYVVPLGKGININEAKQIGQLKAAISGYIVSNPELVAKRPVDMDNYGFLPSNPQKPRVITR